MFTLKSYRGHIRNHRELCIELGLPSGMSREKREKEIIIQGYKQWGDDLPNHLYGMFSFAICNDQTGEIICIRDPFGTKPFYYYLSKENELLYGTYLSDILKDSQFEKVFNVAMLQHYLTYTYVPGEDTFFKGVKKLMPGYIIVKMIYGDDIWHAVTRTRGITGFVGPKGRPLPLGPDEIKKLRLEKVAIVNIDLAVGDKVEVLEGALFGFAGTVVAVDTEAGKCRVMVEMFGRETPVDLTLEQIKKLN